MIRDYLFDIGKIVEGAANGDYPKVDAYAQALGAKLDSAGEKGASKRVREILSKSKARQVTLARTTQIPPLPVDAESRIPVADEERNARGSVPIFLSQDAKSAVDEFLQFFRAADKLIASGVGISPSLLMYGPPGVGKTQLARFIAAELDYPLITARSDAIISSYLGSTAKNLRAMFDHAASRPCVLFLDEFDAIAKMRDDDRELGELKRVVISLMQNIDAMGRDHVLLAATNHEHLLDPAIWRRFAYKMEITKPDFDLRRAMIAHFFGAFASKETVSIAAAISVDASGALIKDMVDNAIRKAVVDHRGSVTNDDVLKSWCGEMPMADMVCAIHDAAPKTFTQVKLAKLFSVTQGYISQILKRGRSDAKQRLSANEGGVSTKRV